MIQLRLVISHLLFDTGPAHAKAAALGMLDWNTSCRATSASASGKVAKSLVGNICGSTTAHIC